MTRDITKVNPNESARSGCLIVFLSVFAVFATLGIWVYIGMARYISHTTEASVNYYCRAARLSSYEPLVSDHGFLKLNNDPQAYPTLTYNSLETRKYKNYEELIKAMPEGFSGAIEYALTEGRHEEGTDKDNAPVTRYYVPEDKLPLDEPNSISDVERYYLVLKYPDGSYRFAVLVEVTDPDN
ncbi:MAG: hypothetical protein J5623_04515 [Clostridiales bacterium]|nr:hypothetical protein [Clostridiales bacterium]